MKPWWMTTRVILSWRDRVRVLFGVPLQVRFVTPDGQCHAACTLEVRVGEVE